MAFSFLKDRAFKKAIKDKQAADRRLVAASTRLTNTQSDLSFAQKALTSANENRTAVLAFRSKHIAEGKLGEFQRDQDTKKTDKLIKTATNAVESANKEVFFAGKNLERSKENVQFFAQKLKIASTERRSKISLRNVGKADQKRRKEKSGEKITKLARKASSGARTAGSAANRLGRTTGRAARAGGESAIRTARVAPGVAVRGTRRAKQGFDEGGKGINKGLDFVFGSDQPKRRTKTRRFGRFDQ